MIRVTSVHPETQRQKQTIFQRKQKSAAAITQKIVKQISVVYCLKRGKTAIIGKRKRKKVIEPKA